MKKNRMINSWAHQNLPTQGLGLLLVLLLMGAALRAQTDALPKQRYLGLGINLNNFQSGIFRLNVDPLNYLRAEVQFGTRKANQDVWYTNQNGQNTKATLQDQATYLNIGLFACLPMENFRLFAGLVYQQNNTKNDQLYYNPIWSYYEGVYTDQRSEKLVGPGLGAEYRFGNRFAVGADFNFLFGTIHRVDGAPNSVHTDDKTQLTRTSLFFRFFPF